MSASCFLRAVLSSYNLSDMPLRDVAFRLVEAIEARKRLNQQRKRKLGRRVFLLFAGSGALIGSACGQNVNSYYEFGTLVSSGLRSFEVKVLEQSPHKTVVRKFLRTHDTKSDPLHVGDQVEVLFTTSGGGWIARRIIALPAGVPSEGPAPSGVDQPTRTRSTAETKSKDPGDSLAPVIRTVPAPSIVHLGSKNLPQVAPIITVPLGVQGGYSSAPPSPVTRMVPRQPPSAACHQSDPSWARQPITIAVLDFRYPTEREESHDTGKTSGGSGMAVADLVYSELKQRTGFLVDRGDRRRLDRSDIAGAARLGRELGVDAVLEGTFAPLRDLPGSGEYEGKLRGYELNAGVVDTCTGQVLMKLTSDTCTRISNGQAEATGCRSLVVTPKEAEDPDAHATAFGKAIDALLHPLEPERLPANMPGVLGAVVTAQNGTLTGRLAPGVNVRSGDALTVHASRLAKNPTTYTLESLQDQEIGRVTIKAVQGSDVTGSYVGDIPAKVGDSLEVVLK